MGYGAEQNWELTGLRQYAYSIYGLELNASFPLACLDEAGPARPGGVRLVLGDLPADLPGASSPVKGGVLCSGKKILLHNPRASFYIEEGSRIRFPYAFAEYSGEDQWFVLNIALAHLLRLHGCIFLHASAVELNGKAYAFLGPGGSGKSTTAAAFTLRGCRPLADDLCILAFAPTGGPSVLPGYHRQDLRSEAVARLALDATELIWSAQAEKYVRLTPGCVSVAAPLARLYELRPDSCSTPVLERLDGIERLRVLVEGDQHPNNLHERAYLMGRLAEIAGSMVFKRLRRPQDGTMFEAALAMLEQDMRDGK